MSVFQHPCGVAGCAGRTRQRFCEQHQHLAKPRQRTDTERPTARQRGYSKAWEKARAGFLLRNPLCAECQRHHRITPANVVDHIVPHRGDMGKFWDRDNWQPLCTPCHGRKTAWETKRYGTR